jgi:GNAT superfamily N-acetyltransferase
MTIALATAGDLEEISGLWLSMVLELAPTYEPRRDWWLKMSENLMNSGIYHIHIARENHIIGFMDYFIFPEPSTGKIHAVGQHLYLRPVYRGGDTASKLYRFCIRDARKLDATVFEFCCFQNDIQKWEKKRYEPTRTMMRRYANV